MYFDADAVQHAAPSAAATLTPPAASSSRTSLARLMQFEALVAEAHALCREDMAALRAELGDDHPWIQAYEDLEVEVAPMEDLVEMLRTAPCMAARLLIKPVIDMRAKLAAITSRLY